MASEVRSERGKRLGGALAIGIPRSDFLADTLDWQYDDDSPFDDEDYKNLIAHGFDAIGKNSNEIVARSEFSFRDVLEGLWDDIDMPAILRSSRSMDLVQSMSVAELEFAHASLVVAADFSIQPDGVCRLNPELARCVAQLAVEHCAATGQSVLNGD